MKLVDVPEPSRTEGGVLAPDESALLYMEEDLTLSDIVLIENIS